MTEQHCFEISIGDWSEDGHAEHQTFVFAANKPIEDVREAYFAAQKLLPDLDPATFSNEYEKPGVPDAIWQQLKLAGCPLPDDRDDWYYEAMAKVVAWYCMQGDADLVIEYAPKKALPTLEFYGYDKLGRHISGFGYGFGH